MAPPITVVSEQNATTWVPATLPTAASMPLPSSGVISSRVPSSKNAASRKFGLRGSSSRGSLAGFWTGAGGAWVMRSRSSEVRRTSGAAEGDGDVVSTEAEGVVQRRQVALGQRALLGGDVEADVLGVLEVDRRRDDPVLEGQHHREGLERPGRTEQVTGHRLGRGEHQVLGGLA